MKTKTLVCILGLAAAAPLATHETVWATSTTPVVDATENVSSTLRLEVSLSARELYVYENGEQVKSFTVAIGKEKHPTPQGEFRIQRVIWNPTWVPPKASWARDKKPREPGDPKNPMGKAKIFFRQPDYYIHGTTDRASLGQAASHGCVRMSNTDVVELARLVMEHGGAARPEGWFTRVKNRVRTTQDVRLATAVRVVVRE